MVQEQPKNADGMAFLIKSIGKEAGISKINAFPAFFCIKIFAKLWEKY